MLLTAPCLGRDPGDPDRVEKRLVAVPVAVGAIVLDGNLDEPEWGLAEPATDFVQREPHEGRPASEPTEVRVLYDQNHLYIGVICHDSEGRRGLIAREMRRNFSPRDGDIFQVVFDTFGDRRNAVVFATNPKGAMRDMQTSGDGESFNSEWDAIWDVRVKITDSGWRAEFAIPFKSLRFDGSREQTWGVNFERTIRRRNEITHWAPIPQQFRVFRVSMAGSLEGVRDVRPGRNLYLKPYVSTPLARAEGGDWDFKPDAGLDVKYGLTSGLTLDLTLNTDFSQVEADDAQINFSRFSLFFPEKREFFLENQQIFEFGNVGTRGGRRRLGFTRPGADLIPFFSRRIGIVEDIAVPILGGARLTGRAGRHTLGLVSMQTAEQGGVSPANFTVGRLRRDLFRNSDVGVIFTGKTESGSHYGRTYGADANFRFFNALEFSSYLLKSAAPGQGEGDGARFLRAVWRDRLLDLEAYHISIEDDFEAEIGFVPRVGIKKSRGQIALTPRPEGRIPWVREFRPSLNVEYVADQSNRPEGKEVAGRFSVEFNDTSRFTVGRRGSFERLYEEDAVLDRVLAPGDYRFSESSVFYSSDNRRMFSGFAEWREGEFYHGRRTTKGVGIGFSPNARLTADLSWERGNIRFPADDFSTDLVSTRVDYSFNTAMLVSALIQYNSRDGFVGSNIRFRWIHRPLSDFYIVYNESRVPRGDVVDRALIAKITRLLNF